MSVPIQEMRKLLVEEAIPEIDITEKVMRRIEQLEVKKRYFFIDHKVAMVVMILLICGTGFASYNLYQLFNHRGEVVLQYGELVAPSLDDILNRSIELRDQMLADGEAMAFFWLLKGVQGAEDGTIKVIYMQKPYRYQTPEEVVQHPGLYLKQVPELVNGYRFRQAVILHSMGRLWNVDTGNFPDYPNTTLVKTERVKVSPYVQSCTIEYERKTQTIMVNNDPWVSNTLFSNRLQELGMTKVTLPNSEALFVVEGDEQMVIWVREAADYGYVCSVKTRERVSREDLIRVAEEVDDWEFPPVLDFASRKSNKP